MIQIQQQEMFNDADLKDKLQVRILNPLRGELQFVGKQNLTYDVMRTSKLGFLAELRIQDQSKIHFSSGSKHQMGIYSHLMERKSSW